MTEFFLDQCEALCDRICYAYRQNKPVVFIVGSPLTAPINKGDLGVLSVDEIVELVQNEFEASEEASRALDGVLKGAGQHIYQQAFQFLISRRGAECANEIVRRAVLNAYRGPSVDIRNPEMLEAAEQNTEEWFLTPAVESLGKLLALRGQSSFGIILTTNFDPLLQIAIRKANGSSFTTMLHREGNLSQTRGEGAHVIHLHGSWRGSDTLHTPRQLTQDRPQLKASLAHIARNALLVAIGYGGWDDVITTTLAELVTDDSSFPEIAWAFYSSSHPDIVARNKSLLEKLRPGLDRGRVSLYLDVNCHDFFPRLVSELAPAQQESTQGEKSLPVEQARLAAIFEEKPDASPVNALPKTDKWFGRTEELSKLEQSKAKVIVISGIGGQGKSSLASTFFEKKREDQSNQFFDWKDCREQGNTVQLAICSAIENASKRRIPVAEIARRPIAELVQILISELLNKSGLIVFDNVDHYIDLEDNSPLGPLKVLMEAVLSSSTEITFLFTARPVIRVESPAFLELRLQGLCANDARQLFEYRYSRHLEEQVFQRLYDLTSGHPLWLSIIAAQSVGTGKAIESLLNGLENSSVDLPKQMLRSTWALLNSNQQHVLRTLAELERPEEERNIEEITQLNYNRLSKAISKLKAMSLVETKIAYKDTEVLDLHPLIRQFVRDEFPKKDRETFIGKVIVFIDRRLFQFRKKLGGPIPHLVLEMWIHKVDLQINQENFEESIETLSEIKNQLDQNGLSEELARLGKRIFTAVDWLTAANEFKHFDSLFNSVVRTIIELEGKLTDVEADSERWLRKYEQTIPGKSAQYINYCDLQAYKYWFRGQHEDAIAWAKKGVNLKERSNVDTASQCEHTLALAQRDSGNPAEALEKFREGLSDEQIFITYNENEKRGQYYGNVGRCYQIQGDIDKALRAYRICGRKLEEWNSSVIDQGYLRQWVAEAMESQGRKEDALMFYRAAADKWKKVAPSLATSAEEAISQLTKHATRFAMLLEAPIWKCENRFEQWVNEEDETLAV